MTEAVGQHISENPDEVPDNTPTATNLYVQADGGVHVATIEADKRSIEVMTSVVFDAKNIKQPSKKDTKPEKGDQKDKIPKARGRLTSKQCALGTIYQGLYGRSSTIIAQETECM